MQSNHHPSGRASLRAIFALTVALLFLLSSATPALGGLVEKFTDGSGEVAVTTTPEAPSNDTAIAFPQDSRVREAGVTLRTNQTLTRTAIEIDRGNASAWMAELTYFDPRSFNLSELKDEPFSKSELGYVALNSSMTRTTKGSENASTHLFAFNLSNALGGAARDVSIILQWSGMGTQLGTVKVDEVHLYVADLARGVWHKWGNRTRIPSTQEHSHFITTLGPNAGWQDEGGYLYILAAVNSLTSGAGSSMSTSFVQVDVIYTWAPGDLEVDVGEDGEAELAWNGTGAGLYGLQNELADGSDRAGVSFEGESEHVNFTSFLVPKDAEIVSEKVALAGEVGEVTTEASEEGRIVPADGETSDTGVDGIPDYAKPTWAEVVLEDLKNAGMEDQSQKTGSADISLGDYGSGTRSIAQTFKPSSTGRLVRIEISLAGAIYSNAPDIMVDIRTTNSTGHPTNVNLGSVSLNGSTVNSSTADWYQIEFDNVDLIVGTQYAIVLSVPTALTDQKYKWENHISGGDTPYRYGTSFFDDTSNGRGPWLEAANTDQTFVTFMETNIGTGVQLVKIDGQVYSTIRTGPLGKEYVYQVQRITKDAQGVWNFTITNGNPFPISMNWTATVFSDVCPQDFGLKLSTAAGEAPFLWYNVSSVALCGVRWLSMGDALTDILLGAPIAYTSPSGIGFVRVNVTAHGNVTGGLVLSGLRVRYFLDVRIEGPDVVAAAEAYHSANPGQDPVVLPIAVRSSTPARVLLSDPTLVFDLKPTFTTATQILEEDGNLTLNLNTMFDDDHDNNALAYEVVTITDGANLTTELNGSMLTLLPAQDYYGEMDVTVRGTDSSELSVDGVIRVVVTPVNDAPVLDIPLTHQAQAKSTLVLDLSDGISDVDNETLDITVDTNSSYISVEGHKLIAIFDDEGMYTVNITMTDGLATSYLEVTFEVGAAEGYPSISTALDEIKVPFNRPVNMELTPYGSDTEDPPESLTWEAREDSDLFDASINESSRWLTITALSEVTGLGDLYLTLTDTEDHSVSMRVVVNVTDRVLEPPRIDQANIPRVVLKKGDTFQLDLSKYVTDETPVVELQVDIIYSKEDIVVVFSEEGVLRIVAHNVGKATVTVTLTDSDLLSSFFMIDTEVKGEEEEKEVNWTLWIMILGIILIIMVLVAWPRGRPTDMAAPEAAPAPAERPKPTIVEVERVEKAEPKVFRTGALRKLEQVLLFHSSGQVLSQYTRRVPEGVDADLESAVISAVQEHLEGRLRTREEPADLIELEGMRVVIERGADLAIAAVLTGEEPENMRKHLRRTMNGIQTHNEKSLERWDGDIATLHALDNAMVALLEALINESGGREDLSLEGEKRAPPTPVVEGVPPLEDEDEPLKLIKDIIGDQKARELSEGRHEPPEEEPPAEEAEGGKEEGE